MNVHDRALDRLIRLLALNKCGAAIVSRCDQRVRLQTRRGEFAFAHTVLDEALRRALIVRSGEDLRVTAEGAAFAKRNDADSARPFAAQHTEMAASTIEDEHGIRLPISVNANESPLARLFHRRSVHGKAYLSKSQFAAGERLRRDFEQGQVMRRITMRWENSVPGKSSAFANNDLSDMALDARRRVDQALVQLEQSLRGVVLDVCCFLKGLEQVERERQWPPRSAKLMLRTALSVLAVHYGYEGQTGSEKRPIVHWGDGNHRPTITG